MHQLFQTESLDIDSISIRGDHVLLRWSSRGEAWILHSFPFAIIVIASSSPWRMDHFPFYFLRIQTQPQAAAAAAAAALISSSRLREMTDTLS